MSIFHYICTVKATVLVNMPKKPRVNNPKKIA